ncbi:hypothetical protein [Altererythrobacter sp. MF3-039]|uniref:hypothetical protein n=1 Tax=Altererythrobacter sp. MF3-039 TaxID=3252901 RepID=UPI00390C94A5
MIRLVIFLLSAASLSGCVAAAAIPVLAGGSMLRSDAVAGSATETRTTAQQPATASSSEPATGGQPALVRVDMTSLPPPTAQDVRAAAVQRIEARSFDDFYGYALAQASLDPLEAPMRSALLTNPGSLEPIRHMCGARAPVVLVDLDPEGTLFDPAAVGNGNAALGEVLAVLRSRGITIAWVSALGEEAEPAIRNRLVRERLDPQGADLLLLVSEDNASKQQSRITLAETHCPIAIAGDARDDFDELFAYLKNPDAALALNEMFGAGWFLTPNPID